MCDFSQQLFITMILIVSIGIAIVVGSWQWQCLAFNV